MSYIKTKPHDWDFPMSRWYRQLINDIYEFDKNKNNTRQTDPESNRFNHFNAKRRQEY